MDSEIKIIALDIDENDSDFTKYRICFANNLISSSLEFYSYLDSFDEFATKLESFPVNVNDSITFQVGEDSKKWAYYMKLSVYCFEPNGNSAIHVKINNHEQEPDSIKAEFFIKTVPSSLNKLGNILKCWNPKEIKEVIWKAD